MRGKLEVTRRSFTANWNFWGAEVSEASNDAISLMPHNELVQKMARDLYFGNGKPALTVRMALQEENMEQVQTDIREIKDVHKANQKLIIGTLVSSLGGLFLIVVELLKH
jgi:hypothetical protein